MTRDVFFLSSKRFKLEKIENSELNLKTFAISFNYQVRLLKAIQLVPAIQFKFHCLSCLYMYVTVSILAVELTTSHSRDQCGLFYKTATVYFRSKASFSDGL